jgi:AcrR family transcriptional regulator
VAPPRRSEREPYDQEAIVDVAVRVFTERGYDGARMDHIAEAAGIAKASVYHHVKSKEELLRRGVSRALDALFAVLDEELASTGAAVDRLAHILRRTTEIIAVRRPEVALLIRVRGNTETERWALERRREFDRQVARLIEKAVADGDLSSDVPPRLATRLLFGMVNSITEWYHPDGDFTAGEIAAAAERLTLTGYLTPQGRTRSRSGPRSPVGPRAGPGPARGRARSTPRPR